MTTEPKGLTDDELLALLRNHFSPTAKAALVRVAWKDGIDIDEPTYALRRFVDDVYRAAFAAGAASVPRDAFAEALELLAQAQSFPGNDETQSKINVFLGRWYDAAREGK